MTAWRLAALAIALLMLLPLGVAVGALATPTGDIWAHLTEHVLPAVVRNTAGLSVCVAIASAVLGGTAAWLTAMVDFPGRRFFAWALLLPLALPGYVIAFALAGVFDYSGAVANLWQSLFGVRMPRLGAGTASAVCLSLTLYPYVYLLVRQAFVTQGQRCLEVAQSLGMDRLTGFRRVALPMARPWFATGVALVVMETLADFGTVKVFNFDTFTTAIYGAWFGLFSLPAALQLSALLLLFVALAVAGEQFWRSKARYVSRDAAARPRYLVVSRTQALLACTFCVLLFAVAFVVPVLQLVLWAIEMASSEITLRYWSFVRASVSLGVMAAVFVTLLGLLLGYSERRAPGIATTWSVRIATLGYAMPGTVLAVGFFVAVSATGDWLGVTLTGTILVMLLAYAARFLAVGYGPLGTGLQRITPNIDDAARGLGVSGLSLLRRVHWPMLRTGVATAALLVFVDVMKELPITLLTRPFGWDTLAVRIFQLTTEGEWQRAAIPALAIVAAGLLPVLWLHRHSDRH
ncbi:MAG: iron ABC transporter permease [Pseudomonadota bacterium]